MTARFPGGVKVGIEGSFGLQPRVSIIEIAIGIVIDLVAKTLHMVPHPLGVDQGEHSTPL